MNNDGWHSFTIGNEVCIFVVPHRYQQLELVHSELIRAVGSQGIVCRADDSATGLTVAIKKVWVGADNRESREHEFSRLKNACREHQLLGTVRHRNVICLLDAFTPQTTLETFTDMYLVMKFMDFTLDTVGPRAPHEHLSKLLYGLLSGVKHLHDSGIIHRDLKPQNIGIKRDLQSSDYLRILDFGLARTIQHQDMTKNVTTLYYRAPEIMLGMEYDWKADVWSIGCIFGGLFKQEPLFCEDRNVWKTIVKKLGRPSEAFMQRIPLHMQRQCQMVVNHAVLLGEPFDQLFPSEVMNRNNSTLGAVARDLLERMLKIDPHERISIDEALQHPYVARWHDPNQSFPPSVIPQTPVYETFTTVEQFREYLFRSLRNPTN